MSKENKPGTSHNVPNANERGLGTADPSSLAVGATPAASAPAAEDLHTAGPREAMPASMSGGDDLAAAKARIAELEARLGIPPSATEPSPAERDRLTGKHLYRVKGPGGLKFMGIFYKAGAEIRTSVAEAQEVDDHLEYIGPVHRPSDTQEERTRREELGVKERQRLEQMRRQREQAASKTAARMSSRQERDERERAERERDS